MILADTSVWIDHLARPDRTFFDLLELKQVLLHPFVVGEIALGSIANRAAVLKELLELDTTLVAEDQEVLSLIETNALSGSGLGYVDAHLLASTLMTDDCKLWTYDRRLAACAERLGVIAELPQTRRLH